MADIPRKPESKTQVRSAGEVADLAKVRAVAKAGYQGRASVAEISEAVKRRDDQRAERERQAAKVHYLGRPKPPR